MLKIISYVSNAGLLLHLLHGLLSNYFLISVIPLLLVTIESAGALPPEVLFTEAVKILEDKCERVITELS